uniref:RHS repeat domain-containing protein n=1 Tax=Sediminibacterium sp. TaxID=1917865 RepID=UPI0025E1BB9B
NGYLYVYVSNQTNLDVFFDNLQLVHSRGPLLEETHYYPFGLTMAGISSKAAGKLENRKKFNAGTELNTDFNLNWYETNYRSLDPQLGRFWQIDPLADVVVESSPYVFANNNPIILNDPLGLIADSTDKKGNVWHGLPDVVVKASGKSKNLKAEKSQNPNSSLSMFTYLMGAADTYYDIYSRNYDHKNYTTTKGKIKPFPIDIKRMSKQAKAAQFRSYTVKNVGFGMSLLANLLTAIQVRDQYLNGNINPLDALGLTLGTTGLAANGLAYFGFAPKTLGAVSGVTGAGGMVLGTYQNWMTTFQIIYNTKLYNKNSYVGDSNAQFQAAMDEAAAAAAGNQWY